MQREANIPLRVARQQEESMKPAPKIDALNQVGSKRPLAESGPSTGGIDQLASITTPTLSKDYIVAMEEYAGRLHPSVGVKFASHVETQRCIMTILLKMLFEEKADIKDE